MCCRAAATARPAGTTSSRAAAAATRRNATVRRRKRTWCCCAGPPNRASCSPPPTDCCRTWTLSGRNTCRAAERPAPFKSQVDESPHQVRVTESCCLPQAGIHAGGCETRHRVHLVEQQAAVLAEEEIDPRQARQVELTESLERQALHPLLQV